MKHLNKILPITMGTVSIVTLPIITSCNDNWTNSQFEMLTHNVTGSGRGTTGSVSNKFRIKGSHNLHKTKLECSIETPTNFTGSIEYANVKSNISWNDVYDGTFSINFSWTCNSMTSQQSGTFDFTYRIIYHDDSRYFKSDDMKFTISVAAY